MNETQFSSLYNLFICPIHFSCHLAVNLTSFITFALNFYGKFKLEFVVIIYKCCNDTVGFLADRVRHKD